MLKIAQKSNADVDKINSQSYAALHKEMFFFNFSPNQGGGKHDEQRSI
jgi:hypothetical protein